jgi:hypothetical protein
MPRPDHEPTVKQRKFAAAIADGESKTEAFAKAYSIKQGTKRASVRRQAVAAAERPAVRREVERLLQAALPAHDDIRALHRHAITRIAELARDGEPGERLRASIWLAEYSDAAARIRGDWAAADPDKDLQKIRAIFQKSGIYDGEKAAGERVLDLEVSTKRVSLEERSSKAKEAAEPLSEAERFAESELEGRR